MKKQLTWTTVKRKPSQLKALNYNPRRLTDEQKTQLDTSLEKFGYVDIACIDTDNTIIGGHQRIGRLIEKGLGNKPVDVRLPNRALTKAERKELNIRLNKNTGEWDEKQLAAHFEPDELTQWGFTGTELEDLGFDVQPDEQTDVDFKAEKRHRVIVECTGKQQQTKLYKELVKRDFNCTLKD